MVMTKTLQTPPIIDLNDLIKQLAHPDRNVRHAAAESLGQSADIRAAEALCFVLSDKDRGVRSAGAWALDRALRNSVDAALQLDDQAMLVLCSAFWNKNNDRYVRSVAATALGRTSDARAASALCSALTDVDAGIFSAAADSMVQIGDPCILPLCSAIASENMTVSLRAQNTLGRICVNSKGLAQRILSSTILSSAQIVDTLWALKDLSQTASGMVVSGIPANLARFCTDVCKRRNTNENVKRSAEGVLAELERRANSAVLLRASQRDIGEQKDELLRPIPTEFRKYEADELMRASGESDGG